MVYALDVVEAMSQTLKQKIITYFEDNPEEELSRQDMLEKFGGTMKTLEVHLKALKSQGYLEYPKTYRRVKQ